LQNARNPLIRRAANYRFFGTKSLGNLVGGPPLNQRVLGSSPSAPTIVFQRQFGVNEVERQGRFTPRFTNFTPVCS
jgi:hypothetical protein